MEAMPETNLASKSDNAGDYLKRIMALDLQYDYVSVRRVRKTGALLLQEQMEDLPTGALTPCGDARTVDSAALGTEVLEALNRFHVKVRVKPSQPQLSESQQKSLARSHDVVHITRNRKSAMLAFTPMIRYGPGGWTPHVKEILLDEAQSQNPEAIREAIRQAFLIIDSS